MARIRSSLRGKVAAVSATAAAAAHDIDFPHLWRQLRAAGWTHKRPVGLSLDWGYATPDGSRVFYGEVSLVTHALKSGLLGRDDSTESADTTKQDAQASVDDEAESDEAADVATKAAAAKDADKMDSVTMDADAVGEDSDVPGKDSDAATNDVCMGAKHNDASGKDADEMESVDMDTDAAAKDLYVATKDVCARATHYDAAGKDMDAAGKDADEMESVDMDTDAAAKDLYVATKDVCVRATHYDAAGKDMDTSGKDADEMGSMAMEACAAGSDTDAVVELNLESDEGVRVSQIDTTTQLSQSTFNALFDRESDVELSQAAVPRAFDLSPRDLAVNESQMTATSLQVLSEVPGLGSETAPPAPTTPTASGRALRPRVQVKRDVNFVADDENISDYESFSSGESDGRDVDDEDESPDRNGADSDEEVLSDTDAAQLDTAFIEARQIGNDALDKRAQKARADMLRAMQWTPAVSTFESDTSAYDGLGEQHAQPVAELHALWDSPQGTFFFFIPKSLWVLTNVETNRYSLQQLERRAVVMQAKQVESRRETLLQIRRRLEAKPGYQTHELLHVVGLLVARMLCPQKRRFAAHWSMVEDGALAAGNFGRFMSRNRCQDILRDLHVVDNEAPRSRDTLWKLRPVVEKLQQQFLAGWSLPAVFSFDEGVLPSTSRRNTTRVFMPDKPHRYRSKMFMTCDSRTAYCHRFELYAAKRNTGDGGDATFDHKTGAPAVVRNLKIVLGSSSRQYWHAVVVDRYCTSVLLAIEHLGMGVYMIGTIMIKRLGYENNVKEKRKTRPVSIPRGTFKFSRSLAVPNMVAFHWRDRKPVHYLCTGAVMTESSIGRKIKQLGAITVPCPRPVTDYQAWMGGVDVHDQLRLQSYSLQMSTKFTKYYTSLLLGFIDLALVNAYISHKEAAMMAGNQVMKRGEWYAMLQNQLLQLKAEDFTGVVATPQPSSQKRKRAPVRITHQLEQSEDWVTVSDVQKRRQLPCKVCALLRMDAKKSYATTFFCERCSVDTAKLWLCNKIRRSCKGVNKTCFDIWHDDFDAGSSIPARLGKRVVLRRPGQRAGNRKKTSREPELAGNDDSESD